jgi:hypothetical protein
MRYWLILAVASLTVGCKENEGKKIQQESMPTIDRFFLKLQTNDFATALNDLIASNPYILPGDSDVIDVRKRFSGIAEYSGAYRGRSFISKKIVNDDLAAFSYLVKYDKKFYRFIFVFYNNGTNTKIFKFSFDDSAELELEESMKLYF